MNSNFTITYAIRTDNTVDDDGFFCEVLGIDQALSQENGLMSLVAIPVPAEIVEAQPEDWLHGIEIEVVAESVEVFEDNTKFGRVIYYQVLPSIVAIRD